MINFFFCRIFVDLGVSAALGALLIYYLVAGIKLYV
jgi:hypothetical protein